MPISGTAACGPTGRCDTGRVPQGNYLWDFRQVPNMRLFVQFNYATDLPS